jgi:hypothetical protein
MIKNAILENEKLKALLALITPTFAPLLWSSIWLKASSLLAVYRRFSLARITRR